MAKNEHVKLNDDGTADITLSRPAVFGGVKLSVLRMREPSVNDQLAMEAAGDSAALQEIALFANLLEHAPEDVKRLPLRDYKRVQEAFRLFTD